MTTELTGPFIPAQNGKADSLVIILHGYGDSGHGVISLGSEMASSLPGTAFAAPNAPEMCEMWAQGYQWFGLRANQDGSVSAKGGDRKEVIMAPAAALNAYIDAQLAALGLAEDRLVVAGFSQGAMMAMYAMPRRASPCAGVIGYSGMLVDAEGLLAQTGIVRMPMLVVHGALDDVVVPRHFEEAQKGLKAAGFEAETILRPNLAHSIDDVGFNKGLDFIRKVLS